MKVYMCSTDWQYEVGEKMAGKDTYPRVYPTLEELYKHKKCVKNGIITDLACYPVEIEMTFVKSLYKK